MVKYLKDANDALLGPAELSEQLSAVLRRTMPWLMTISEAEASVPEREGKWSAKEVIGHLTDSAVNDLRRIMLLQIEAGPSLLRYEHVAWTIARGGAESGEPGRG